MTDLHILVVVDAATGRMRLGSPEEAPVDSGATAFDDPDWRPMTEAEQATVMDAEAMLSAAIDAAGLRDA